MSYVGIGGGANPYIPQFSELSGMVQTEFARNPGSMSVNRYSRLVQVEQDVGHYLRIDSEEHVRFLGGGNKQFAWVPGNPRPSAQNIPFDLSNTYQCKLFNFGWSFPQVRANQAVWDVDGTHARMRAVTAMTNRALIAATRLADSTQWAESNSLFASISALGTAAGVTISGDYDNAEGNIRLTFLAAAIYIQQATAGAVKPDTDIVAVMNPRTAGKLGATAEITNYIKTTPFAPQYVAGKSAWNWFLPPALYNVADVVVEDATMITSAKEATSTTKSYVFPDNAIAFVSRPGGLVQANGPSFSTLTGFVCAPDNMSVWTWDNPKDRLREGAINDWIDYQVTGPRAGVYIEDITA